MTTKQITTDAFFEQYRPRKNHLMKGMEVALDGCMYETYGAEAAYVRKVLEKEPGRVWTVMDGGCIVSGYRACNRSGYLITKNALPEGEAILVGEDEDDGPMDETDAAEALFQAVDNGDVEDVARLLAEGVDADAWGWENSQGDLPLQAAARLGEADGARIVEMLLDAGADIDFQGEYGSTALHRAVYVDHGDDWATARLLVRRGANVGEHFYDRDGLSAAEAACKEGHQEAVLAMLEEVLEPKNMGYSRPLLWYAAYRSPNVVARLLAMGVHHDGSGHSIPLGTPSPLFPTLPVLRAAAAVGCDNDFDPESDHMACLLLLLDAGASLDETDHEGADGWTLLGDHAGAVVAFLEARSLDEPLVQPGMKRTRRRMVGGKGGEA